jgi:hypothetical protein
MINDIPIVRFGKPSGPLLSLDRSFFDPAKQDRMMADREHLRTLYRQQPPRTECKNCASILGGPLFVKKHVEYLLCSNCGHLNGRHQDTEEFYRSYFSDEGGAVVAAHYSAADRASYKDRVTAIYRPKVDFLKEVINANGADANTLSYLDIGAGGGHFVGALLDGGVVGEAIGYEASRLLVDEGNAMLGGEYLKQIEIPGLPELLSKTKASVACLIFTLEHLLEPRRALEALCRSSSVQYVLIAVPVHSPSSYLELVFPTVFERHLFGHTHLYTEQSLRWLCDAVGLDPIGEWWFGADAVDLFRSCRTRIYQMEQPAEAIKDWEAMMLPMIDGFQQVIDRHKISSEVHFVCKVRR